MEQHPTLTERAAGSAWVAREAGLAEAVAKWEADHGARRASLPDQARQLAQAGPIPPHRLGQHAVAAGLSRAVRTVTRLPGMVSDVLGGRDPRHLVVDAAVEGFVDQLALGGPASAEVARVIQGSGSLFPSLLTDELALRSIGPANLMPVTVKGIVRRSVGALAEFDFAPVTSGPVTQMHHATLPEGRPVDVRLRRPGVAGDLAADVRMMATLAAAGQRMAPDGGGMGMGPMGFVELIGRMGLEAVDLRIEALDLIELGLIAEDLGLEHVEVVCPLPGYVSERVLVTSRAAGTPLPDLAEPVADATAIIGAITALTLEAALVHGTFWADPSPEHLFITPEGGLVISRASVVGRLGPQLRAAGITFLKSLFSGEPAGQVEAMRIAGAVPPDLDVDALVAELAGAKALDFGTIMMGGEDALLGAVNEAVRLMLKHKLAPPVEVVLLLRTVFAVGRLSDLLVPEGGGFLAALMGLLPKLPALLAAVTAEQDEG